MSIEQARQFVALLHDDDQLRQTVHLDSQNIVNIAKAQGYTFTPAEVRTAISEHWAATSDSNVLSEALGF